MCAAALAWALMLAAACAPVEDGALDPGDDTTDGGVGSSGTSKGPERCASPPCADDERCKDAIDCRSGVCTDRSCRAASSSDGVKNASETDVDCGGPDDGTPRCADGKACASASDCTSLSCTDGVCLPATASDGIRNGTETDVDCGGSGPTNAPGCADDRTCATHADCASNACAISGPKAGRCVPFRSCVQELGGFTCGRDDRDFGGTTVELESCCETATVPGSTAKVNRFAITAGRMRAFIERLDGNVRGWVQDPATKPEGWNAAWNALVPSTKAEAEIMLGAYWINAPNDPNTTEEAPHSKRSCGNDSFNGHTYWVSSETDQIFSRAELDPKVLNCVGWHLVTAFCAWDGGRLAKQAELRSAFTNGNTSTYPWGYAGSPFNAPYSMTVPDDRLNHRYNYGFPGPTPASNRITWWLSPPGRFWRGWNANDIEIAGNVFEWTSDKEYNVAWNLSFENHEGVMEDGGDWRTPNERSDVPNGYYALGARCAY